MGPCGPHGKFWPVAQFALGAEERDYAVTGSSATTRPAFRRPVGSSSPIVFSGVVIGWPASPDGTNRSSSYAACRGSYYSP